MTSTRTTGGPLPPVRLLRFLALGDSYTIGEGVDPAGRWPVQLAHALRREGVMLDDPTIVATTGGGLLERTGTVEFVAQYRTRGPDGSFQRGRQHENSRFVRVDGEWMYQGTV